MIGRIDVNFGDVQGSIAPDMGTLYLLLESGAWCAPKHRSVEPRRAEKALRGLLTRAGTQGMDCV